MLIEERMLKFNWNESQLATPNQLDAAYGAGAEWCAAGYTSGDGHARYPMQSPRSGCSSSKVADWGKAAKALAGATLATSAQLEAAWKDSAEWCSCAAVKDDDRWPFPMHHAIKGCGGKKGIIRTCSAGGANCYSVKPPE